MKTDLMQMENIAMEKARRMTEKESVKGREKTTTEKKMKERVIALRIFSSIISLVE